MDKPQVPPTRVDGVDDRHDDHVEDDSVLRPVTTPPERDRVQARVGDAQPGDDVTPLTADEVATTGAGGAGLPIIPIAIVAILVIVLLVLWLT